MEGLLIFVQDCISMAGTLMVVIIALLLPVGVYFAFHTGIDLARGVEFWQAANIGLTMVFFCFPLALMTFVLIASLVSERKAK